MHQPNSATGITPTEKMRARKKILSKLTGKLETVSRLMCVDDHALLLEGI